MATRQRRTTLTPPATASLLRRRRRQASRQRLEPRESSRGQASAAGAGAPLAGTLVSDAGVNKAIGEVDQQVHEGEKYSVDEDDGHDHRIVAAGHRQDEE